MDPVTHVRDDSSLFARLRQGDESAFDHLVQVYGGSLIQYAAHLVGSLDSGQEIVQDVLFYMWRERTKLEPSGNLSAYLYRAVRNRAIDIARSERATHSRENRWGDEWQQESDVFLEVSTDFDAIEIRKSIWDALAGVSPRCREIFMLVWDQQLPYREIAYMLGLAEPTVRSQVSRAMKRIIEVLGPRYRTFGENERH